MPMMHIGLIVPWLEVGGMETFIFLLGGWLQQAGNRVEIVATESSGAWFERAAQFGLAATLLPESESLSRARHARRVACYLRERAFDICLLNHARYAQASLAMLGEDVPAIPVVHNDAEVVYQVACANAAAWNVAVAVSPKVLEKTRQLVPQKTVVNIPYGIEVPKEGSPHRDFEQTSLQVLYVGRLVHAQKGILLLPDIVAACLQSGHRIALTIVGDGPDAEALQQRIAALRVTEAVVLKGALPREAVFGELDRAHVLLMPSYHEGLSLALLEALARGCVPVVTRLTGITDSVLHQGESGFLAEPDEVGQFARALGLLAADRGRLRRMAAAARRAVEQRFSVEVMGRAYRELFRRARQGEFPLSQRRSQLPRLDRALVGRRDHLIQRARLQRVVFKKFRNFFLRNQRSACDIAVVSSTDKSRR